MLVIHGLLVTNKLVHIENKDNHLATIYFIILMGEYTILNN